MKSFMHVVHVSSIILQLISQYCLKGKRCLYEYTHSAEIWRINVSITMLNMEYKV